MGGAYVHAGKSIFTRAKLLEGAPVNPSSACRAHALRISEPVAVARLAERVAAAPLALVAAAGGPPVRRVLEGFEASGALAAADAPGAPPALLLVGPEGDFTPAELGALAAAGGTLVGLGERRLRVETAAMALLAAAMLFSEEP